MQYLKNIFDGLLGTVRRAQVTMAIILILALATNPGFIMRASNEFLTLALFVGIIL
jgi:hypothetical protein